ncbi:glycosyltransferase family 4 protein [Erysipelothrix sp. HDW6C]|uniref:glycosyltransferase family 4 protein n=1 Tax=Erysipelothrix sp. HDW6C TaxID=2714930 RepID=UPI001408FF18|nr:glycosyltransferase family 4 protein [Erysipelothrix sp. HDW6C]QIK70027.1 glycosyltransferase family 4 protein [Erysipelothrix sp. HDW6C]
MKIAVVANFGLGLFNFRLEVLQGIKDAGHDVIIFYPRDEYAETFENNGFQVIDISLSRRGMNPIEDFKLYRQLKKLFKANGIDLVVTYTIKPNIYASKAAQRLNIPSIANITGLGTSFETDGIMRKIIATMYRSSLKKARHVFFQNDQNLEVFQKLEILNGPFSILPGSGVNLEKFQSLPYPEDSHKHILFVGRLMESKGIIELMEAINEMERTDFTLHVVGMYDQNLHDFVEGAIEKSNGKIVMHGYKTNISDYLLTSHALINPSHHEGMSNVLLEAAACARPLLASNIPGCKEIVNEGVNGFLFEAKSSESIQHALNKFLDLPLVMNHEMGDESRRWVEEHFDRKLIVKEYLELIKEIDHD